MSLPRPSSHVSHNGLFWPAGSASDGADSVRLTAEQAQWTFCGLRVLNLAPGEQRVLQSGEYELAVLPLQGSATVTCEGHTFELKGRTDIFKEVSDFCYIGRDSEFQISSQSGGQFSLPMAKCSNKLAPKYGPSSDVQVEVRGAGQATRQINNFMSPSTWHHAEKLCAVEVLTPEGNWSSYPPHKHDTPSECEAQLEEIYYFRCSGGDNGFGFHRTYTHDGAIDSTVTVKDGDIFLVPRGYHGPCVAPPGYNLYYLNVLAGPGEQRSMQFCDDPRYHWVREQWKGSADSPSTDPRVPMTTGGRPEKI